ncbi:MAG: hypothetical protein QOK16_4313 [Solirubrobacteraceae bacterium]|jgi:hypothetical protein|nr:hypothetical protein [Solirubrobacteraceae bacterium]
MWGIGSRVRSPATGASRRALAALALIGLGLAAAPVVFRMFDRAPQGAVMMREFATFMTDARLNGFQRHIRDIDAGVREADGHVSVALEGRGAAAHERFDRRFPAFAHFHDDWPPIHGDMSDLLDTIQTNAGNYRAVAALPSFRLFPWFFVIPGVLVLVLATAAALAPRAWTTIRWALAALGIGLVLAPVAFQMFERAPKGGRMMTAFKTIETRENVETMQGYFGTIAVGQGALRLQVVPALRRSGLDSLEVAQRFPDVATLNRRWVAILNDLTPMIGAMSDNVDNYQAIAALPPFALFPWFFVAPGVLVAGLALASGRRDRRILPRASATGPLTTPSTPSQGGAT